MSQNGLDQPGHGDNMDAWYSRCPGCDLVCPPSSADHALTGPPPAGTTDWSKPVRVACLACGRKHDIGLGDLLPHDAAHTCSRCANVTSVPAAAAEVICRSCHLYAPGPAARADQAVADRHRITQHRHFVEMREALLQAKQRAARTRAL